MKKCGMKSCQVPLEEQQFNKNKTRKDGLSSICRICSKERSRRYYAENTIEHKKAVFTRNRRLRQDNLRKVYDYLSENFCVVCNEKDITVLEFDHLRDKDKNISELVSRGCGWETIKAEIEKCQVLCANCHRRKTAKDQNWFVLDYVRMRESSGRLPAF